MQMFGHSVLAEWKKKYNPCSKHILKLLFLQMLMHGYFFHEIKKIKKKIKQ